jgi:glycosyltransferase involved in cell wall biosynthesis
MRKNTVKPFPPPLKKKSDWPWGIAGSDRYSPEPVDHLLPKISIVTPSYNQGRYIEETIRSVLLQGYPNLEYIIIDGGSTDNSTEVVKKYSPWLAFWVSEEDRGQAHAINKGLKKSSGEIVAYLNSDDLYLPGAFEAVSKFFLDNPEIDIVYGDCRIIDEKSRYLNSWRSRPFNLFRQLCRNFIYQPTCFVKRRVLDAIGYFDETLYYTMDIDYWYRAGDQFKFAYLPVELACFRLTDQAKTGKSQVAPVKERRKVIERYLADCIDEQIISNRSEILSWHHYHAGEQLYLKEEFQTAKGEFLKAIRSDPVSIKALCAIVALSDIFLGVKIFPTLNRLFASPKDR